MKHVREWLHANVGLNRVRAARARSHVEERLDDIPVRVASGHGKAEQSSHLQ